MSSSAETVFASFAGLDLVRQTGGRYMIRRGRELVALVDTMTAGAILEDPSLMCAEADSPEVLEARELAVGRYRAWSADRGWEVGA